MNRMDRRYTSTWWYNMLHTHRSKSFEFVKLIENYDTDPSSEKRTLLKKSGSMCQLLEPFDSDRKSIRLTRFNVAAYEARHWRLVAAGKMPAAHHHLPFPPHFFVRFPKASPVYI